MNELDLFRDFCRGVAAPSPDAQRRASVRLESALDEAVGREKAARSRHGRRRWPIVAVASVILVGGLLVTPALGIGSRLFDLFQGAPRPLEVGSPVWSPGGRKIVFPSRRSGNWEIYVVNADGSGQRNLTGNPGRDSLPVWSPDGRKIAFVGHREETDGIYVMNTDGSEHRRLAPAGGRKASLAWSPDGRKIAFLSDSACGGDFCFDLFVVNADGSGERRLTQVGPASDLAWSPDGRKIAFARGYSDGNSDVYIMNADGSGLRRLTRNPANDHSPDWSPDGRKIVFISNRDAPDERVGEVYVMNADGSGQQRLTQRRS